MLDVNLLTQDSTRLPQVIFRLRRFEEESLHRLISKSIFLGEQRDPWLRRRIRE